MPRIDTILTNAVNERASDIHFASGGPVWMRLDGDLHPTGEAFSSEQLEDLLFEVLSETERLSLKDNKNIDKSYCQPGVGNFRINIFYTRRGISAVIRVLPEQIPSIQSLGLPPIVETIAQAPKGLILVAGPTGSGKSTTLAAILDFLNTSFPYHILTAEDPIEFVHENKRSLISQREIGNTCPSFASALKYALREDPDVILVGEMRDLETINLALTAAETGHLVLGTLHTRGAASTVDRIIESFPAMQQPMVRAMLAESLQAVISQTLLKKASGQGRVAAYEIMVNNFAISNLIREGKTFQIPSIMQTSRKEGMVLMDAHLKDLVAAGEVTQAEADGLLGAMGKHAVGGVKNATAAAAPAIKPSVPPAVPQPSKAPASAPIAKAAPAVVPAVPTANAPAPAPATKAPSAPAASAVAPKAAVPAMAVGDEEKESPTTWELESPLAPAPGAGVTEISDLEPMEVEVEMPTVTSIEPAVPSKVAPETVAAAPPVSAPVPKPVPAFRPVPQAPAAAPPVEAKPEPKRPTLPKAPPLRVPTKKVG